MINDVALANAIRKIRKLRLIDHVPIKDSPPPAVTFLAVMQSGLGGMYDDAALEYIFRHFLKYYEASVADTSQDRANDTSLVVGCPPDERSGK